MNIALVTSPDEASHLEDGQAAIILPYLVLKQLGWWAGTKLQLDVPVQGTGPQHIAIYPKEQK